MPWAERLQETTLTAGSQAYDLVVDDALYRYSRVVDVSNSVITVFMRPDPDLLADMHAKLSAVAAKYGLIPILIDKCGCGMDGVTVGRGLKSPLEGSAEPRWLCAAGPSLLLPLIFVAQSTLRFDIMLPDDEFPSLSPLLENKI
ncbi:MAG: hypothetical protein H6637_07510 [Ardenticatenales bacterium]|nr:hypothetical protein [Ardenticatenales bacterium]